MKYVERADNWPSELFDLEGDPGESVNLIGDRKHSTQVAELRERVHRFFDSAGAVPLTDWRKAVKQTILIDAGYYDGWEQRKPQPAKAAAPE